MSVMERIGRYRLVARIGAGSFATVWQGHDDDLDVPVAIKVLAENWAVRGDVRNRFISEARLMRRIQDSRIIRVYDIGELADHRPYFVMDYCDSGSLEQWRRELRPPAYALRAAAEACRALQVLHDHRVVHRDVTPGNLLLDARSDGSMVIRLSDLGVAKSMVDDQDGTMTAGTPSYMALEQATGSKFDHRADIYSMACVTYALLTGQPPFRVRSLADLLSRDRDQHPAPLGPQLGIAGSLDDLLREALSQDPEKRPASAKALADRMDRVAAQIEAGGTEAPNTSLDRTRVRHLTEQPAWPILPDRESAEPSNAAIPPWRPPDERRQQPPVRSAAAKHTMRSQRPNQPESASELPNGRGTSSSPATGTSPSSLPPQPTSRPDLAVRSQANGPGHPFGIAAPQSQQPPPPTTRQPDPHTGQDRSSGRMVNDWSYLPADQRQPQPPAPTRRTGVAFWATLAIIGFVLAVVCGGAYFAFFA